MLVQALSGSSLDFQLIVIIAYAFVEAIVVVSPISPLAQAGPGSTTSRLSHRFSDSPRSPVRRHLRGPLLYISERETHIFRLVGMRIVCRKSCTTNLQVNCAALTPLLFQARLRHHCSQWTHGRLRRSNKRVSKVIPCCGICSVWKHHDCSFGCHCSLCCP